MSLVEHTQGIYDILANLTSYTGGWFPNSQGINEISATTKFMVFPKEDMVIESSYWYSQSYAILIHSNSEANLRTAINKFLDHSSDRPGGFIPAGDYATSAHPYHVNFIGQARLLQLGPNSWECVLELIASYEVVAT